MLKRYQVMINDWLADAIKSVSEKYDISFSETIRIAMCIQFMQGISKTHPKYKSEKIDIDAEINELIKVRLKNETLNSEALHKFFSDLYFETRKAIEFWEAQEKKQKK